MFTPPYRSLSNRFPRSKRLGLFLPDSQVFLQLRVRIRCRCSELVHIFFPVKGKGKTEDLTAAVRRGFVVEYQATRDALPGTSAFIFVIRSRRSKLTKLFICDNNQVMCELVSGILWSIVTVYLLK